MSELDNRKKLLVAESEVYRQMIKLEIQNFRIYGTRAKQKANSFRNYGSLLMMLVRLAGGLGGKKKRISRIRRFASLAFSAWQMYSRFGQFFGGAARRRSRSQQSFNGAEEETAGMYARE